MPDLNDLEEQLASVRWDIQYIEEEEDLPFLMREEQFLLGQINQERKNGLYVSGTEENWND